MDRNVRKLHQCNICRQPYKNGTEQEMIQHMFSAHQITIPPKKRTMSEGSIEVYVCPIPNCGFSTSDEERKRQHILWHNPSHRLMGCECPECIFQTFSEEEWHKHFNTHNPDDLNWYCPICGEMYESPYDANLCCSKDGLYTQVCKACHGYKTYMGRPCPVCNCTGFAPPEQRWDDSSRTEPQFITCRVCNGTGHGFFKFNKCAKCYGKGKLLDITPPSVPTYALYRHGRNTAKVFFPVDARHRPPGYRTVQIRRDLLGNDLSLLP